MVRSTVIVRASDALPLAASVDDEQVRLTSQLEAQKLKGVTKFRRSSPSQSINNNPS